MKWTLSIVIFLLSFMLFFFGITTIRAYNYPLNYQSIIIENANKYDVDSELIASIINVESHFSSDVVSNKGAVGLMQILPTTAEWVDKKIGIDLEKNNLFEPSVNIEIGTYYLSYLFKIFDSADNVICAYNAGLGNVQKWLTNKKYSPDGKKLTNIPFEETSNYLAKVKKCLKVYANKFQ